MMSNIKVVYPTSSNGGAISAADAKQMSDVFVDMVKGLATEVEGDWSIASELLSHRGTDDALMINIVNNKSGITIKRHILYNARDKSYNIAHDLFQMNSGLQNSGIANKVNAATVNLANKFPFKTAFLEANLDVGGYAWLRKGAWPDRGLDALIDIANLKKEFGNKREVSLAEGLLRSLNNLTEAQARVYVMQPRFSIYKDVFLGSDWTGDFRLSDPLVKAAMQGDEYTKTKLIIDRIKETKLPIDKIDLTNLEAKLASLKPLPETAPVKPLVRPTSNRQILDEYTRHQTYLMRYADGLGSELATLLDSTNDDLNDTLLKWLAKVEDRSLSSSAGRSWQKEFEAAINSVRAPIWDDVQLESFMQLEQLALTEAAVGAAIIQSTIPVALGLALPSAAHLTGIVRSQPLEGRVLKEWLEKAKQADINTVVTGAKAGIIQGQTPAQITRNLMGSSGVDYSDGIVRRKATRELNSLVRTIVNGVQTEAKQALYEANADIIQDEIFIATLDSGTTLVCAGNDNKVFKRGEGPMPPLHFGCRSTRVPYINPDNFGNRGFDPTTETELLEEYAKKNNLDIGNDRDSLPRGHKSKYDAFARKRKRELIGQVPALTSYNKWLKEQSVTFQNETLGKTRAELFRSGKLSIDKFTSATGETLTLKQLAKKYDLNL